MTYFAGLDVIVVNYKTSNDLEEFLASYLRFPPTQGTLWVVNVCPTPSDQRVVKEFENHLQINHVILANNYGYARACNRAALEGTSEALAIFNADVVLTERALDSCYHKLMENPTWGILGPRQVDEVNRLTAGGVFGTPERPQQRQWHHLDKGQCSDTRDDAITISGAAMFVKRNVWNQLDSCPLYRNFMPNSAGPMLETAHFYEDTFLAYHARAHGHRCVFYGEVCIIHKWSRATPSPQWASDRMVESREIYRRACRAHSIGCE